MMSSCVFLNAVILGPRDTRYMAPTYMRRSHVIPPGQIHLSLIVFSSQLLPLRGVLPLPELALESVS